MKIKNKLKKLEKNKKASIGATFTGILALFIILFFSVIFILGCIALGEGDKLINMNEKIILDYKTDLIFQKAFFGFLEKRINFNNETINIIDLIDKDSPENPNKEKLEKFREFSDNFLQNNAQEYGKAWIRIYEQSREDFQYFHGETYQEFEAYYGISAPSANPCDPNWGGAILFTFPLLKNKRLVICLEPEIKPKII